ncbi:MAG: hypothetical protein RLZZ295_143 [Actinomycetota bacterium]
MVADIGTLRAGQRKISAVPIQNELVTLLGINPIFLAKPLLTSQ